MQKVREVFRLSELGFNQRAIARATGIARSSSQEYLRLASIAGINYEQASIKTARPLLLRTNQETNQEPARKHL